MIELANIFLEYEKVNAMSAFYHNLALLLHPLIRRSVEKVFKKYSDLVTSNVLND